MGDRVDYFERYPPDNLSGLPTLANEYERDERYENEGNAYARVGDVLFRFGGKDEARSAYKTVVWQAEKHEHTDLVEDLRLAILRPVEYYGLEAGAVVRHCPPAGSGGT